MNAEQVVKNLLQLADISVNGARPWDIQVLNPNFYRRVLSHGSMGLGESYMDGWWECEDIAEMLARVIKADLANKIKSKWFETLYFIQYQLFNLQKVSRAFHVGEHHYDIGNDLYQAMLDKRLTYTCAYWDNGAKNLDDAQAAKLDLVCRKLNLQAGQSILDIGCGWGSFAKFAAEQYGVKVVGITVSKKQAMLAQTLCQDLPIDIRLQDYRHMHEKFDHIVSLGMFEHVGKKNYRTYMRMVNENLNDGGRLLLQTIGTDGLGYGFDPWLIKYIFPNAMVPEASDILESSKQWFTMEDWHNFSFDYYYTLTAWMANVDQHWPTLKNNYDTRFYRMWRYYLMATAATFKARTNQLWQVVLAKNPLNGPYVSVR